MYHDLNELKEKIAKEWSVEQLLDALGWDMFDLVEAIKDQIDENKEELEALL